MQLIKCKHCGSNNDGDRLWADEYCQGCWESYCADEWWKLGARIEEYMEKVDAMSSKIKIVDYKPLSLKPKEIILEKTGMVFLGRNTRSSLGMPFTSAFTCDNEQTLLENKQWLSEQLKRPTSQQSYELNRIAKYMLENGQLTLVYLGKLNQEYADYVATKVWERVQELAKERVMA